MVALVRPRPVHCADVDALRADRAELVDEADCASSVRTHISSPSTAETGSGGAF